MIPFANHVFATHLLDYREQVDNVFDCYDRQCKSSSSVAAIKRKLNTSIAALETLLNGIIDRAYKNYPAFNLDYDEFNTICTGVYWVGVRYDEDRATYIFTVNPSARITVWNYPEDGTNHNPSLFVEEKECEQVNLLCGNVLSFKRELSDNEAVHKQAKDNLSEAIENLRKALANSETPLPSSSNTHSLYNLKQGAELSFRVVDYDLIIEPSSIGQNDIVWMRSKDD